MCLRIIFNMHINAGQIPDITKGNKDAFTYLEYAVIRGFEHQYIH